LKRFNSTAAIALLALAASAAAVQHTTAQPSATVIRAGLLIDVEAGTAAANQTIVIENGRITAVGGRVVAPAGADVVDLSKYTVLPGLFDAHTHLCLDVNLRRDAGSYFYTTLRDPNAFRSIRAPSTPDRCSRPASRRSGMSATKATTRASASAARSTAGSSSDRPC